MVRASWQKVLLFLVILFFITGLYSGLMLIFTAKVFEYSINLIGNEDSADVLMYRQQAQLMLSDNFYIVYSAIIGVMKIIIATVFLIGGVKIFQFNRSGIALLNKINIIDVVYLIIVYAVNFSYFYLKQDLLSLFKPNVYISLAGLCFSLCFNFWIYKLLKNGEQLEE